MSRTPATDVAAADRRPRVSGDEPVSAISFLMLSASTPRERG